VQQCNRRDWDSGVSTQKLDWVTSTWYSKILSKVTQIGRNLAQYQVIVFSIGLHFGRYFSQTHLVTLLFSNKKERQTLRSIIFQFRFDIYNCGVSNSGNSWVQLGIHIEVIWFTTNTYANNQIGNFHILLGISLLLLTRETFAFIHYFLINLKTEVLPFRHWFCPQFCQEVDKKQVVKTLSTIFRGKKVLATWFSHRYKVKLKPGWPNVYVKKSHKICPNPIFDKINALLVHGEKGAQKFSLLL
jgi:hypothetical protein